jgi:signal transduction histidine kinase
VTRALQSHERLRSALRVALALSGLLIYLGDTSEHPARRPFAIAVLLVYLGYAVALYAVGARRGRYVPAIRAAWIDLAWVTLLVAVSEGTSSIFFPLYLFPILHASFGNGFRSGIAVALGAVASFAIVGAATAPRGSELELNAFVTRPLYLFILGYVIAAWGDHEVLSRARLALLRDVTSLSNPRFGIDRTVGRFLEAVRRFYDADACRLVVEPQDGMRWMRTALRRAVGTAAVAVPPELARVLLPELPGLALRVRARPRWPGASPEQEVELELETEAPRDAAPTAQHRELAGALAGALDAGAVLSVPFRYHATAVGRLHVSRGRSRPFDRGEVEFVRHLLDQVVPVLENIRLVDRLASDAAEEERRRIARDLHDSVIQPYLGLRLGLSAAQKAISAGRIEEGSSHVARLVDLADGEIQTLRGYVRGLREGAPGAGGGLLDEGVRRFCSRFSDATGIRVHVTTEGAGVANDRLAAEVFQMVAEALSNVRRHTSAEGVAVRIRSGENRLDVTITNDSPPGEPRFFPRSLGERAAALGGSVRVEQPATGATAVHIEIPL